jgi:hypothetical protein
MANTMIKSQWADGDPLQFGSTFRLNAATSAASFCSSISAGAQP